MDRPAHITQTHVDRGAQMRAIVADDIVRRGMSLDESIASLASFLGIDREAVKLGIAMANEWKPNGS